jgi:hypothetical protein
MKCGPKFGHSRVWIAAVFSVASVLQPASGWAQRGDVFNAAGATTSLTAGYENQNGGGTILLLQVYSENEYRRMDRQCVVKLTNETTHEVNWQSTTPQSDASFAGMAFGHYEIEVSGVGYITAHKELTVISSLNTIREQIVLQRDPAAVQLAYAEAALPAHARKDTKRGVMALKSGNLKQAQRWLDAAYQAAPGNADLNFLKGYLSYQENDFEHARLYLGTAASLNQHDAQSLTLLGRLDLKQEDYVSASSVLEKAVAADSEYWMARDLLAGSYLKQRKYEAAREQAELAIAKGREGAGSSGESGQEAGRAEPAEELCERFAEEPGNAAGEKLDRRTGGVGLRNSAGGGGGSIKRAADGNRSIAGVSGDVVLGKALAAGGD